VAGAARITQLRGVHPPSRLGSNAISLPKPRESNAKSEDLRGGGMELQQVDLQGFSIHSPDFAHNSGR
jgi:hypothetical protein